MNSHPPCLFRTLQTVLCFTEYCLPVRGNVVQTTHCIILWSALAVNYFTNMCHFPSTNKKRANTFKIHIIS